MKKQITVLLAVMVLLYTMCVSALAVAVPDVTEIGSVRITMRAGGEVVPGGSMTCYRVGAIHENNGDFSFVLTGEFIGSGVSLDNVQSPVLAHRLASYAAAKKIAGTTRSIGSSGTVIFRGLKPGLYLMVQQEAAPGYSKAEPFLVSLPMKENGVYVYDVDASPKVDVEKEPVELPEQPESPEKPDEPKLPQTGQLNWPVPVLAAGGLCLMLLGRILRTGKKERYEK